jgi:hypothetical protein
MGLTKIIYKYNTLKKYLYNIKFFTASPPHSHIQQLILLINKVVTEPSPNNTKPLVYLGE